MLNFPLSDYAGDLERLARMSQDELVADLRRESVGFSRGTSTFRGVSWRRETGRWEARIGRLLGRKYTYAAPRSRPPSGLRFLALVQGLLPGRTDDDRPPRTPLCPASPAPWTGTPGWWPR